MISKAERGGDGLTKAATDEPREGKRAAAQSGESASPATAAQLSRIAANDPDPAVMIVKLDAVGGIFLWLCSKHEKARTKRWLVLERRRPVSPVRCQDCAAAGAK